MRANIDRSRSRAATATAAAAARANSRKSLRVRRALAGRFFIRVFLMRPERRPPYDRDPSREPSCYFYLLMKMRASYFTLAPARVRIF